MIDDGKPFSGLWDEQERVTAAILAEQRAQFRRIERVLERILAHRLARSSPYEQALARWRSWDLRRVAARNADVTVCHMPYREPLIFEINDDHRTVKLPPWRGYITHKDEDEGGEGEGET